MVFALFNLLPLLQTRVSNVVGQPGEDPDTGLPIVITITPGQKAMVKKIEGKGRVQFIMAALDNKQATISLTVDGDVKVQSSPRRLYLLGATNFNNYVWIEKYDETNDEYGVHMGRTYEFTDSFELLVESPKGQSTNLLDYNIFWESDL